MSEFHQLKGSDYWVSDDIPAKAFPKKPPEWMHQHLKEVYRIGYSQGKREMINKGKDFLEEFLE